MSTAEDTPLPEAVGAPAATEPPPAETPARASTGGFSELGDAAATPQTEIAPPPPDPSPIKPETAITTAEAAVAPSTPAPPKTKAAKTLATIAAELVCSICCSVMARAVVANPCGHVFCGGCLERWLRRKWACPNCQQRLDVNAFVAAPALDHIVSALVDASPNLRRRDSVDRRRNRSPVPPTPPPPPRGGFVTAAEMLRRTNGAVPPPPTPSSIMQAVSALDPRSDIERAVASLDGLELTGRSDIERAVDRLDQMDLPGGGRTPVRARRGPRAGDAAGPSSAATPVRARRGGGRASLVDRQRQHTAERLARRPPRAPVRASPASASPQPAATPPGPRRWRNP